MPAVLVHGVPDTAMLWDDVRNHLKRSAVIAHSMPGFGAPVPAGFEATKDAYAAWLIARIEEVGEPVDIVGHDWGSLLAQRVVSLRPDLVRTWAVGSGPVDREYVWHATAQTWQTPDAGEQLMAAFTPDTVAAALTPQGLEPAYARAMADKVDETMKSCILTLYRSAIKVGEEWTNLASPTPPGLVLWGKDDPYVDVRFGERLAERTGAKLVAFENCGHWWPHQRAADAAALLNAHWGE